MPLKNSMKEGNASSAARPALRLVVAALVLLVSGALFFGLYLPRPGTRSANASTSANPTSGATSTTASPSSTITETSSNSTSQYFVPRPPNDTSSAPCAEPYKLPTTNTTTLANGTGITQYAEPVFVVGDDSTMDICILLWDQYAGSNLNYSSAPYLNATLWPGYTSYTADDGNTIVVQYSPAINVTVTQPQNFSITTNQTVVVEYEISTGENSTGFDGLGPSNSIPYSVFACRSIPLAVGYSASQVNNSDFPPYAGLPEGCLQPPLVGYIIGYTGGSVVYLTEENRG